MLHPLLRVLEKGTHVLQIEIRHRVHQLDPSIAHRFLAISNFWLKPQAIGDLIGASSRDSNGNVFKRVYPFSYFPEWVNIVEVDGEVWQRHIHTSGHQILTVPYSKAQRNASKWKRLAVRNIRTHFGREIVGPEILRVGIDTQVIVASVF